MKLTRDKPAPHEEAMRQLTYSQHVSPYFRVSQEATSRSIEDGIEKHSSHSQIVLKLHLVLPIILSTVYVLQAQATKQHFSHVGSLQILNLKSPIGATK